MGRRQNQLIDDSFVDNVIGKVSSKTANFRMGYPAISNRTLTVNIEDVDLTYIAYIYITFKMLLSRTYKILVSPFGKYG